MIICLDPTTSTLILIRYACWIIRKELFFKTLKHCSHPTLYFKFVISLQWIESTSNGTYSIAYWWLFMSIILLYILCRRQHYKVRVIGCTQVGQYSLKSWTRRILMYSVDKLTPLIKDDKFGNRFIII